MNSPVLSVEAKVLVEKTEAAKTLTGTEKEQVAALVTDVAEKGRITSAAAREVEESEPHVRAALIESFASCGITVEFLAQKLREGFDAEEVRYASKDGIFCDERRDTDHKTRHKYLETALKALGADKPQESRTKRTIVYRSKLRGEVRDVTIEPMSKTSG